MNPELGYTLLALFPTIVIAILSWLTDDFEMFWWVWKVAHASLLLIFLFFWLVVWLIGG